MKEFVELNQPEELNNETEIIEWLKQNPWLDNFINSKSPSVELNRALENNELIEYPELTKLTETPEDPTYHGEKNTWAHTLLVLDEVEKITNREKLSTKDTIIIKLGALCHDLGKPLVTKIENGKVTAYQHEEAGESLAFSLLNKINTPKTITESIIPLVKEHLFPILNPNPSNQAIKKLLTRLGKTTVDQLLLITEADQKGRLNSGFDQTALDSFKKSVKKYFIESQRVVIKPLLSGQDLINLGYKAGSEIGVLLKKINNAQKEGLIKNKREAINYINLTKD